MCPIQGINNGNNIDWSKIINSIKGTDVSDVSRVQGNSRGLKMTEVGERPAGIGTFTASIPQLETPGTVNEFAAGDLVNTLSKGNAVPLTQEQVAEVNKDMTNIMKDVNIKADGKLNTLSCSSRVVLDMLEIMKLMVDCMKSQKEAQWSIYDSASAEKITSIRNKSDADARTARFGLYTGIAVSAISIAASAYSFGKEMGAQADQAKMAMNEGLPQASQELSAAQSNLDSCTAELNKLQQPQAQPQVNDAPVNSARTESTNNLNGKSDVSDSIEMHNNESQVNEPVNNESQVNEPVNNESQVNETGNNEIRDNAEGDANPQENVSFRDENSEIDNTHQDINNEEAVQQDANVENSEEAVNNDPKPNGEVNENNDVEGAENTQEKEAVENEEKVEDEGGEDDQIEMRDGEDPSKVEDPHEKAIAEAKKKVEEAEKKYSEAKNKYDNIERKLENDPKFKELKRKELKAKFGVDISSQIGQALQGAVRSYTDMRMAESQKETAIQEEWQSIAEHAKAGKDDAQEILAKVMSMMQQLDSGSHNVINRILEA